MALGFCVDPRAIVCRHFLALSGELHVMGSRSQWKENIFVELWFHAASLRLIFAVL
jgi:hypothetical protein